MAEQEPRDETRDGTRVAPAHTPAEPYTVHADALSPDPAAVAAGDTGGSRPRRGGPDPIALVVGLVSLVVATLAATSTLASVDPRWVLAAGALLVGGSVLVISLRRRA